MAAIRHTADDFVTAALEIIDEQGLDALTMRSLGDAMQVHGTAIYRHFASRDDLVNAVMGRVVQETSTQGWDDPNPRTRLLAIMRALRATMARHPNLVTPLVNSTGSSPGALEVTKTMVTALEDLGLRRRSIAVALQMLESYMVGATAFDYAAAPEHLEIRRLRRRSLAHAAFDPLSRTTKQIEDINEDAFLAACNALLDACAAMA